MRKIAKRKTNEEFLKELAEINPNINVLDEYVNNKTKLQCKCLVDGNKWYATPNSLLSGHGCPECWKNSIKLDEKTFFNKAKEQYPNIKILTHYTKASDNYLCECKICGHKWEVNGTKIIKGETGCKECYRRNKRLTNDEFLDRLNNITNDIMPLDNYYDMNSKINFKCKICDNIWSTTPNSVLSGTGCPECYIKKLRTPKKTTEQFIEEAKISNPHIEILGEYLGVNKKILCKCNICKFEWSPQAASVLSGYGCPKCAGRHKTTEEFKNEIYSINPDIEVLSEYENARSIMQCKCRICKNTWSALAYNLQQNKGCPNCKKSDGERRIEAICINNNIYYVSQKTFVNLLGIGGRELSYDFYIPEYNLLVEFQGKQHEQPVDHFGGEEQFKIQQEHDKRKREYAQLHNINLLEIWYYDIDNIESILFEKINNLKLESVETVTVA